MSNEKNENANLLEVGEWPIRCLDFALGEAGSGTEQIGVLVQFLDGPNKGKRRTWYGFWTEDAAETTIKALRALGWKTGELDDLDDIINGEALAVVVHEPDQKNVMRDRIRWINGNMGVAMKKQLDTAAKARLANRVRGLAARLGGGAPAQSSSKEEKNWKLNGRGRAEPTRDPREDYSRSGKGGDDAPWDREDGPPPRDDRDAPPERGRGGGWGRR